MRFDRLLIAYQKLTLAPIIGALLSLISEFLSYFEVPYGGSLRLGLVGALEQYLPGFTPILVSLLVLAFTVPFCLFAAKGRLAFLFPVLGYFAIDLVCSFFAAAPLGEKAIDIGSRFLILALLGVDVLLYFLAKRELRREKQGKTS